jgi:hypothetical protein
VDGRLFSQSSPPVLPSFLNAYPSQPGHFEPRPTVHSAPDDIQAENLRRMTIDDNRTVTQFRPPFHPGPPTQLTPLPLRSQYDPYHVPEYGGYMVQHSPYVEYPVFDIYGNVSGPPLYLGHLGNSASNIRYPHSLQSIHSGPGTEVHHPGFPYDFGQRPTPQFYYPTPSNTLISPQIPQHLSVSPLTPVASTPYLANFDQQVRHS